MFGKTLLICGGWIDLDFAADYIADRHFDVIICADSGLDAAFSLGLPVDYIMGDFDSVSPDVLHRYQKYQVANSVKARFVQYPTAKDATDTEMVIDWVLSKQPSEITILGATGGRLDHLLANINVLMQPLAKQIPAWIVDPNNRLYLADHTVELHRKDLFGKYISLIPLTEKVYPLTLQGLEYGLKNHTLTIGNSLGVSNQMAEGIETARIIFEKGILVIVESRD